MSLSPDARLLQALAAGKPVTQRSLSRELGVALGLTNLLIRRLVAKGYVRVSRLRPKHVQYLLTAEGQRALVDMTRVSLQNTVSLYTDTRDQIRRGLNRFVEQRPPSVGSEVVFYGLGDVAEIAFVSLQSTELTLIGAVDDYKSGTFFGLEIQRPSVLCTPGPLSEASVIVTTMHRADEIGARLHRLGLDRSRVFFLDLAISEVVSRDVR